MNHIDLDHIKLTTLKNFFQPSVLPPRNSRLFENFHCGFLLQKCVSADGAPVVPKYYMRSRNFAA